MAGGALASDPVSWAHAPTVAFAYPGVRLPVVSGPASVPAAWYPDVSAADPIPVSTDPDVARIRRDADHLDARRRRRNHDDASDVVTLIGYDHASAQRDAESSGQYRGGKYSLTLIHEHFQLSKT
jgi:hypothetical protein